ncbi:GNAT family N-acetyltransferase [Bifidobacterium sp. MA2]|uniref:GNAT family N-acetyltransferase n=1 Tax=Bifidobacterium santillanense TaxID=2809028 RepID=A0ABS5UMV8_9BIFI|nr:GNAT family N-acetyltransferase [Bifidobacterium santillanense]MBT1172187.1 GNAT family N-acetyltransferase [Bifidobacterium santillanense]
MSETIGTERLLLRPWRVDDSAEAASLFRYASDPEIGPHCGWRPHTSVTGSMRDIRDILAVENNWAITFRSGVVGSEQSDSAAGDAAPGTTSLSNAASDKAAPGEPVGSIALKPVGEHIVGAVHADPELASRYGSLLGDDAMELGYWIGRPFWNRGYVTEALRATLAHAFDTLGKTAVWGGHYVENPQSGRVMAKCGMTFAFRTKGTCFPLIDERHDCDFRIITAVQWRTSTR